MVKIALRYVLLIAIFLSARWVHAQDAALQQDAVVIESLRKNGSDFTKLHLVDYFFVLPTESNAKAIAAKLKTAGYVVRRVSAVPQKNSWEAHVQSSQLIQVDAMQATTRQFTALAKKFGGYYDGWGAPVAK
jgi:regulator of RNase E activity RraB